MTPPKDWDHREMVCDVLPVHVTKDPSVISFWKPTEAELKLLAEGGSVALVIYGKSMPPVSVEVVKE
jgi:hypothetical protein